MSGYLLDTNCISEVVRIAPNPHVAAWIDAVDEYLLYLSVLTLGEIRQGVSEMAEGKRRSKLEAWLEELSVRFSARIVPVDESIAERCGLLAAEAKRSGHPLSVVDGLLAATALDRGFTLVSRNVRDFINLHVPVLNPWQS